MKKLTPVQISGATVYALSPEVMCFLMQDLDLMWVRHSDFPWIWDLGLKIGGLAWIYWAVRGSPIGIAPHEAGMTADSMPTMEPVLL